MNAAPAVSVVIPVYNRVASCVRAVQSVAEQTHGDWELIVVDDGSTVDLSPVEQAVTNAGGVLLRQERAGVAAARNRGVCAASGKWLAFLDSDDYWLPQKLERQFAYAAANPQLSLQQTEEIWIRNGRRVNPAHRHAKPEGEAFNRSLELCCISPSSVLLKRAALIACGGFDERLRVCEDYDLWLRMTARLQCGLVATALVVKHGGASDQLSRSEPAMDRFRVFSLLKLLATGNLERQKAAAAAKAAAAKAAVLHSGATKRGYRRAAEFYGAVKEAAEQTVAREDQVETLAQAAITFLPAAELLLNNNYYCRSGEAAAVTSTVL